ncbi:MAG: flagellar hook basal-body protein [Alphaproteobacteria bacterium]
MAKVVASLLGTQFVGLNRALQETGHNVGNFGTSGFQKHMSLFESYDHPVGAHGEKISYAVHGPEWRNLQQGGLRATGDVYNVAILGEGFLKLEGEVYTRAGELLQDAEGVLRTSDGRAILDNGGAPIAIPIGEKISINRDGSIFSVTTQENIATLGLFQFENRQNLKAIGNNVYEPTPGQEEQPVETPNILQGFLETSNTNSGEEMIDLANFTTTYQQAVYMSQAYQSTQSEMVHPFLSPLLKA